MKKKIYSSGEEQISLFYYWWIVFRIGFRKLILRFRKFQSRRAHRSFRLTRRRDYLRPLEIAGYWSFTKSVFRMIAENKKAFLTITMVIVLANFVLIGLLDQNFITSLQSVADTTNSGIFSGGWGEIGKAGLVIISTFSTGGLVQTPSESQRVVMFAIVLFAWLAVVQICRFIYAGRQKILVRDALYSCGAPIVPMVIIGLVILLQCVPMFLGIIIATAARLTEFANSGVEQMLFMGAVLLLFAISLYWILGSVFALVIVTNQGKMIIYPLQALKIAGDMVTQRRIAILKRLAFGAFIIALMWVIFILPIILLVNFLSPSLTILNSIPIIQIAMLFLSSFSLVFSACYLYTFYRKVIDYDRQN
ncbi:MAG: hypothetical protein Q4A27_03135 [bacterium]|nr:hypothetical protein [bacterium]